MSQALFIAKLRQGLAGLPQPEIDEIASDYEFHFAEAVATGQSEDDITARLGDPTRLARELREEVDQRHTHMPTQKTSETDTTSLRSVGRFPSLLGVLFAIGAATLIYYIVNPHWQNKTGQDGLSSVPSNATDSAKLSNAVNTGTAPSLSSKILVSGEQVVDLGLIEQDKLYVVVDGGGHASAHGRVKELTLQLDGSGKADFDAVQADNVQVNLSGTGDAKVNALNAADVTISGSGTVHLKIKPKLLKQSITGSGQVVLPSGSSQK